MSALKKPPPRTETTTSFHVDKEVTGAGDVPSVTRLLNRKKLGLKAPAESAAPSSRPSSPPPPPPRTTPPTQPPARTSSPSRGTEIEVSLATDIAQFSIESVANPRATQEAQASSGSGPSVRRAQRKARSGNTVPLAEWNKKDIASGSDPLTLAMQALLKTGPVHVIHFKGPLFAAVACFEAGSRKSNWQGARLTPLSLPSSLMKAIEKDSVAEIAANVSDADQTFLRQALCAQADERLTIFRMGPVAQPTGFLVVFSRASLKAQWPTISTFLSGASSQKRAA